MVSQGESYGPTSTAILRIGDYTPLGGDRRFESMLVQLHVPSASSLVRRTINKWIQVLFYVGQFAVVEVVVSLASASGGSSNAENSASSEETPVVTHTSVNAEKHSNDIIHSAVPNDLKGWALLEPLAETWMNSHWDGNPKNVPTPPFRRGAWMYGDLVANAPNTPSLDKCIEAWYLHLAIAADEISFLAVIALGWVGFVSRKEIPI